jgi:hypothetical protein
MLLVPKEEEEDKEEVGVSQQNQRPAAIVANQISKKECTYHPKRRLKQKHWLADCEVRNFAVETLVEQRYG